LPIFNATVRLKTYYQSRRDSITDILGKLGKDYPNPKAFRPIALLNTTAKLLVSADIADETAYIREKHNLLPNTHFGG
ncbi:hypothetical protein SCLCIDRAFT_56342, partial [Scleroderma citrinum Foug A]